MYDVIVLTQEEYIAPTSVDWYIKNVLDEDNYVLVIEVGVNVPNATLMVIESA